MKLKPYPEYKDSGIKWIGEIPGRWEIDKFKHFFNTNMGQTIITLDLNTNGKYPVLSATEKDNYFGRIDNPQFILNEGDFVIPARGNSIGFVTLVKENCVSTQTTIYAKKIKKEINSKFVYYFLRYHKDNLFPFTATAIPQITVSEVKENPLIVPSFPDQIAIAKFLDKKTAKIDALIEKDKKLIELLKEKRTALINHAVTKGLDPNVKLKDSGIQWIGKIPEGWEVRKIKYLVKNLSGNGFPEEEQGKNAGDLPFYKVSDINGPEKFVETANNFVSRKTIKDYNWNVIPEYSLIAPKIGEALKKNHRKITKVRCIIDNNCIAFKTFDIDYSYNYYLFKLINFEWFVNPGAVPSLSVEKLRSLIVSLPPISEQTTIANYLGKATAKIDKTIQKIEEKIKLLEEYKKSLIHHTVTGKIDVRGVEA